MAGIFISYRRDDSAGYAGRLYDRLSDHFGPDQVFMDVDTIKPGQNFVDAVRQAVGGCDGLVAIIGKEWLTISDATGARRLDDPEDIVSLEIATALERGIRVIPVLVQGAPMPAATDFPESLKELAYRNAQEISDRSFNSDAQSLIEALEAPEPELPERDDFVGRQREMAELSATLDAAMAGRGQMVMLSGEPGIGKTRLAQELASRAESLGAQVMWGWCYEHAGAPPYWPYVHPIRTYVETADAGQLSSQIGSGGAAIAEIVPELRDRLPDLGQPTAAEPEQARFRLFDSVATFLKNLAQSQPLLLIVDDLHWADSSSLLMLEFLVREIATSPVLVLGTYRDVEVTASHPMSQTLGNLVRERHFRRVLLGGLTRQEVGEFVEGHKGVNLSDDILEMIHGRTEGNPLFVNEVVELIDPEQIDENTAWAGIIPEGVRDAIGSRLSRLSATCNQVLGTASVIGREFDFFLLRSLDSDTGADGLLAALDEALEAKVIEELPGSVGRYQFGHGLIQQSLYGELSSVRRLREHASIGEALEQMHGAALAEHAAELARHFAEAQSVLGPEKLVNYSLMAGEQALAAFAYEQALGHFERGLAARGVPLTGAEPASDVETAGLLFGLGRAQVATLPTYRTEDGVETLGRAFEYYVGSGDAARVVAIAETPTRYFRAAGFASRALELVPGDSLEAGRLWSRYGLELARSGGSYKEAQESFQHALAIAQRYGDADLEARALAESANIDRAYDIHREAADRSVRSAEIAKRVNNLEIEALGRGVAVMSLRTLGDLPGAQEQARLMLDLADRMHNRPTLITALQFSISLSMLEGDWTTAKALSERTLALAPLDPRQLSFRMQLEYEVGNFEEAGIYRNRLVEAIGAVRTRTLAFESFAAIAFSTAARISGSDVEPQLIEECAEAVVTSPAAMPSFTAWARAGQALSAVSRGDSPAAQEYYQQLRSVQHTVILAGPAGDRLLGLLSQTMGNSNQAAIHFEDAMAFCRKAGYRPELAWTCCDYADLLRERDDHEYRPRATALLAESLTISTELGMKPLMDRAQSRLEILKA